MLPLNLWDKVKRFESYFMVEELKYHIQALNDFSEQFQAQKEQKLSYKMTILCLINENSYSTCLNYSVKFYIFCKNICELSVFSISVHYEMTKKPKLDS